MLAQQQVITEERQEGAKLIINYLGVEKALITLLDIDF